MMKIIRLMLVMMTVGLMTGCVPLPRIYLGADDVYGTVVDAETKEPINDVIVLGVWKQYDGYYGSYSANLVMRESVTDENGDYKLEGWWPRFTMSGHLNYLGPNLIFYKLGYTPSYLSNAWPPDTYKRSDWTGKSVELKKFEGNLDEYATATSFMDDIFAYDSRYAICNWKRVPIFTMALINLNEYIETVGWGPTAVTMDKIRLSSGRCGLNQNDADRILGSESREK